MPHQHTKARIKEAEKERERSARCSRLSVINAFIVEDEVQRPDGVMHSMISTFASAPNCTLTARLK